MTKWSLNIFLEWQNGRKNKNPAINKIKVQCLDTDIANMTGESLSFWLIKFFEELCRENGERYSPRSLYSFVYGIQRFLEMQIIHSTYIIVMIISGVSAHIVQNGLIFPYVSLITSK